LRALFVDDALSGPVSRQKLADLLVRFAEQGQLNRAEARLFGDPLTAMDILATLHGGTIRDIGLRLGTQL
jgi:hypothetical protein